MSSSGSFLYQIKLKVWLPQIPRQALPAPAPLPLPPLTVPHQPEPGGPPVPGSRPLVPQKPGVPRDPRRVAPRPPLRPRQVPGCSD